MTAWLITPRDPLIFRDGRPFTAAPGARATTLPFPFPSTLAGAARTLEGTNPDTGHFDKTKIDDLLQRKVRGPLLIELAGKKIYVPAPADALILKNENGLPAESARRLWLRPVKPPDGIEIDFPRRSKEEKLPALVAPHQAHKEKAHRQKPAFWDWGTFEQWLRAPQEEDIIPDVRQFGLPDLLREYRLHVRVAAATQTADEGGLFVTSGLEFARLPEDAKPRELQRTSEYGLLLETDTAVRHGWAFLGGERRVARWQKSNTSLPSCPDGIREQIVKDKACRLVLLTPAIFEQGYLPRWALKQGGVQAEVIAAAVPRYQTVSGWDYQKGKPKANRRLAPAGSVYFLKLDGDEDALRAFVKAVWMQNVSDGEQDRRNGFGLAVLGTWDGKIEKMEVANA